MTAPTFDTFTVLADYQDITALSAERLNRALADHLAFRDDLLELRSRPLPFVGDVPEPAQGNAWLEAGATR